MITLHKSKFSQFEKLFDYYNFELEQTQRCYYNIFSTELVFNGVLPQRDLLFNRIGTIDVETFYKNFSLNTWSSEKYYNMCLHLLNQRELVRRLSILET
jgi:hypothetical protein